MTLAFYDETTRGQLYAYDIGPTHIDAMYFDPIRYQYNDFGALELISDPTNQYRMTYDLKGQVDSLVLGIGIKESEL